MPGWRIPKIAGEASRCFVVAGGPSVKQHHVDALRGERVMVINSSWTRAPWADYLFFGDDRWWTLNGKLVNRCFNGQIITVARHTFHPRLKRVGRAKPPGASKESTFVVMERTSLAGGMNVLALMGYQTILVLGADNRPSDSGQVWHHPDHPWPVRKTWQDDQRSELEGAAPVLQDMGVRVINLSPVSRLTCWERGNLEDFVNVPEQTQAGDDDQCGDHSG